ncbi:LIC_10190 family membrane protein [Flavobacterium sp.]|uniref:LIC_10190 family membrane protein n=1 Tax=Flavobacterium sp. TaxID=239 RepID=UPI002FDC988A
MVLILLSWLFIVITSLSLGISFSKLWAIPSRHITITSLLGLFAVTLLASLWAIFGPINLVFAVFLSSYTILSGYYFRADWRVLWKTTLESIASFSRPLKILFWLSSLLILVQSATAPFVIDNETYYIQTIKWLNEFGFVPGLANLHLFLGQTSGWHITQSVYSLSFLYENFNDLNGFLLLMLNFWAFQHLQSYRVSGNKIDLAFGLLPLSYLFLFQFVNAPSPDLAVYVIAFLAFSIYTSDENATEKLKLLSVLLLFAVYIKITAVVLLLLPILILIRHFGQINGQFIPIRLLAGLVLFLWVIKNTILTGYPFYPLTFLPYSEADYVVPKDILSYFFSHDMMHSFYIPFGTLEKASLSDMLKHYFLLNGIDSVIGCTTLLLLISTPFIIKKYYPKQGLQNLYWMFVVLLVLLILSSPQYRFYVFFTIFLGLLVLAVLLSKEKIILTVIGLSCVGCVVLVFIPMSFSSLTRNTMLMQNSTFEIENMIFPKPNSKYKSIYTAEIKGNIHYNAPQNTELFWITGNGALPTVSKEQLDYFETYFHVIPQKRGETLREGFKAQNVNRHD